MTQSSLLTIELNLVAYQGDISDPSQFATDPNETTPLPLRNFFVATLIGDIQSVNGSTDVKGTYFGRTRVVKSTPTPNPGEAKADVTRTSMREHFFEILKKEDSAQIGTIMSTGFSGGAAPPGTGLPVGEEGNWAIVGGTGAYFGAKGQVGAYAGNDLRFASMIEDPSNDFGGRNSTFYLHVIPADPPQIMTTAFGPLVFHYPSHIPVTAFTPALANKELVVFASGLGPTTPDVPLDVPFPITPPLVNSPLTVSVGGVNAPVLHAAGVPGTLNTYSCGSKCPQA